MTDQAKPAIGYGGMLYVHDDNSPGNYVKVGEVMNITPPKMARDTHDVTHTESPEGWREFIAGLKDGGEVSCEINFQPDSSGMTILLAQFATSDLSQVKITIPTTPAYRWMLDAILTGVETAQPLDDKMTTTVTFKVSGKPVLEADS